MHSKLYLHYRTRRTFFVALALALTLLLLLPTSSQAHAILLRSDPARDAVLTSAPDQVHMWFSEDLSPGVSTASVVNSSNRRIDVNDAHVSSSDTREMDISLQSLLPPGTYIVLWTTQSADDGHVLRGSFLFYIAAADGTVPKTSGALPGQNNVSGSSGQFDGTTFFSFLMVTLVDLGAVFWVGAQLWRTFVLQLTDTDDGTQKTIEQQMEARFDRKFALPLLVLLLLANIGVVAGQALTLAGGDLTHAFTPATFISLATSGRFGTYWLMRQIVILLAIIVTITTLTVKKLPRYVSDNLPWLNLILGMALLIALTMSGHASATGSNILIYAVLVDWLHLLAASLWIGGMLYISTIYIPTIQGYTLLERARSFITVLPFYSPLAITAVIIMTVTGPFNAAVHMTSLNQLFTTAYGRTLIIKSILVGALLLTSAVHVFLLRPRLAKDYKTLHVAPEAKPLEEISIAEEISTPTSTVPETPLPGEQEPTETLKTSVEQQTQKLTSILRWEPLLGVAVLVCTGLLNVLAGTLLPPVTGPAIPPPTTSQNTKPFNTTIQTSDHLFTIKLTVSPNRFGPNDFIVTVLDSHGVKDTKVGVSVYVTMLDMDMGTNTVNLQPDGKGNFSASGDLGMGGNWGLRVQIRAPDLQLHEATVKILTPF